MTPIWHDQALDELADIWVRATRAERDEVERAVNEINRELSDQPWLKGESRGPTTRIVIIDPLTVRFQVLPGTVVARILNVRMRRRRNP